MQHADDFSVVMLSILIYFRSFARRYIEQLFDFDILFMYLFIEYNTTCTIVYGFYIKN